MDTGTRNRDALVQQLIEIGGFVVMLWIAKKITQPDFGRLFKMRAALAVKRVADQQADVWSHVSAHAATTYNRTRV